MPSSFPSFTEEADFPQHALCYYWDEFTPHLLCYDRRSGQIEEADLFQAGFIVSRIRRCVGSHDEGGYRPCPTSRRVSTFPVCQRCMEPWVPHQMCIFEPQCDGRMCDHPGFCNRDHVVYLAFFGILAKVGMTSLRRLRIRGIEQGADAIAPIFKCANRIEARAMEKEVSKRFKINQELRINKVASQLITEPDWEKIDSRYTRMVQRINFWKQTLEEPLMHLEGYPMKAIPAQVPQRVETAGSHQGIVLGIKGKHLIYENQGIRLLDLSDLPSRLVAIATGPVGRQVLEDGLRLAGPGLA